jgi:NAD(P)-dependent dehydrogenase (short-subunit alcohol dehydrogenase family)
MTPSLQSLPAGYRALVLGASGAIGGAVLAALQADPRCGAALGLSRADGLDLTDDDALATLFAPLQAQAPFHLVFIATGVLNTGRSPEKRLADLDPATMAQVFAVNTIGPALLVKHAHALLPTQGRSLLAVLSARVGSIGDNRKGGWTSYRASKAALNMVLKTAAIEVARRRPGAVLAALHPGTVRSALSTPIIGDAEAHSPEQAARHLLAVLDGLPAEGASGGFWAWDGQAIVW